MPLERSASPTRASWRAASCFRLLRAPIRRQSSARRAELLLKVLVKHALQSELGIDAERYINQKELAEVTFYSEELGVPTRANLTATTNLGYSDFKSFGCANCHRPNYRIVRRLGTREIPMEIWPFSDLLLHDLGCHDEKTDRDNYLWRTRSAFS